MGIPMDQLIKLASLLAAVVSLIGCDNSDSGGSNSHADADAHQQAEAVTGPNGGRLLVDGAFAVELAIFEAGVPPEFRISYNRYLFPAYRGFFLHQNSSSANL